MLVGFLNVQLADATNIPIAELKKYDIFTEVPPSHFQEQFIKDLTNANSLDQIKWVFNKAKKPSGKNGESFKHILLNEINKLPLTDKMATKFMKNIGADSEDLRELIIVEFKNIFIKK